MDIRQLKYFYTIAEEGQITRAARKLHIAQPPLSQSLKNLENEIGVPLFERNGRRMELTDAGSVLYDKAQYFMKFFDDTIIEVQETGAGLRGKLSIGCVKSSFAHIPDKLKTFRNRYPEVSFEFREGDSYLLAEELKQRVIDMAIVRLPIDLESFHHHKLPDEPYVAIFPEDWEILPSSDTVKMEELARLPLLLLKRISGQGQYELIMERLKNYTASPNIITVCPDVDMILELVSEGIGVSIIPEATLKKSNAGNVRSFVIEESNLVSESAVIWLKDHYLPRSAERFIKLFQ